MRKILCVIALFISDITNARQVEETVKNTGGQINRLNNTDVFFQLPRFIFSNTNTRITVKFKNPDNYKLTTNKRVLNFIVNGIDQQVSFDEKGVGSFYYTFTGNNELQILLEDVNYTVQPEVINIWYILGPLLAILLFFGYRIVLTIKKNRTPNMVVNRNTDAFVDNTTTFKSNLKVVRVKEPVEEY